jgi:hypothetical protein
VKREQPQHPPGTHEERRPRSFIASEGTSLSRGFLHSESRGMVRGTKVPTMCGMAKGEGKKKRSDATRSPAVLMPVSIAPQPA